MSLKICSDEEANILNFRGLLEQPKMVKDFFVWIPSLYTAPFRVFNAKLPNYTIHTDLVYFLGEAIKVPTHHETPGNWTCSVYEDDWTTTNTQLTSLYDKVNNYTMTLSNVIIFVTNSVLTTKLAKVLPDNDFTSILNLLLDQLPAFFYILDGVSISAVDSNQLDWTNPTGNMVWNLEFTYNGIKRYGSPNPKDLVNILVELFRKITDVFTD